MTDFINIAVYIAAAICIMVAVLSLADIYGPKND